MNCYLDEALGPVVAMMGGVVELGDACVGDPDLREDYDLGENLVRIHDPMSREGFVSLRSYASFQACKVVLST